MVGAGIVAPETFGVGPVIAATVIGDVGDVTRFASRDHFAAYNGTAPIEMPPPESPDPLLTSQPRAPIPMACPKGLGQPFE